MVTTRSKDIFSDSENNGNKLDASFIDIDAFDQNETELYLSKFLKAGKLNDTQKNNLIELLKVDNQIFPLKLKLTINYINKNLIDKKLDDILEDIKQEPATSKQVQEYLFKNLPIRHLKMLIYCSFLDPNIISLEIVNKLFKETQETLENLSNDGLIELNLENRSIKIHRLVQNEICMFYEKNENNFENKFEILNHIVKVLDENTTEIQSDTLNNNEKSIKIGEEYIQIKHIINESNFQHIIIFISIIIYYQNK